MCQRTTRLFNNRMVIIQLKGLGHFISSSLQLKNLWGLDPFHLGNPSCNHIPAVAAFQTIPLEISFFSISYDARLFHWMWTLWRSGETWKCGHIIHIEDT